MLRYLLIPALLASSPSDANTFFCEGATVTTKVCKLVVRDFDGPRADASRSVLVAALAAKYEVVPLKQWDAAFEQKPEQHGERRWQEAAKRSGVEVVVEGWVHDEERRHMMTISVRDAHTGSEVDSVSAKVNDKGVALDPETLMVQLVDVLQWVDCN